MNRLPREKQIAVVKALLEGNSIRATVRMTGVAKNTIVKLLVDLGEACAAYQDQALRGLHCQRIECDEIWSFCYAKAKNVPKELEGQFGFGDVWTWVAIDADSKLVPSWLVGDRSGADAKVFIADLAERLSTRVQLTTDGHRPYLEAVEGAFGSEFDYAVLQKIYGSAPGAEKRYSPPQCIGIDVHTIQGRPNAKPISTSYVERQNLTMRMGMRRFTRLTNAFSKKAENLAAAVSLHFMHYNFARPHMSLANPYPRTPAMAAGVTAHIWSVSEIVGLLR
ncbi:MAG TPA: IS1 family transposase [Verrucomicrobiae bacterium]|nr:IS1 family transposase [Verrucomicrobiae bacterium]